MKMLRNSALLLVALLVLLVPSRVAAAAATDGGIDASSEAGAAGELMPDASASDASDDGPATTSDEVPLRCDGALCDTTTGATTCDFAEGRSPSGGGLPVAVVLGFAAMRIGRRARNTRRRMP
jgi:hypothetical protein